MVISSEIVATSGGHSLSYRAAKISSLLLKCQYIAPRVTLASRAISSNVALVTPFLENTSIAAFNILLRVSSGVLVCFFL